MELANEFRSFRAFINDEEISSGDIELVASADTPQRYWIKCMHLVNIPTNYQLLESEVSAIVRAAIYKKPSATIRDNIEVTVKLTSADNL